MSPVIVFKDTNHPERMVIGLGIQGSEEDAFIAVIDKKRQPEDAHWRLLAE